MKHRCPRCPQGPHLEDTHLKGVDVRICRQCRSILMTRHDLDAVVAMVGRSVVQEPDLDAVGYFKRLKTAAKFVGHERSIRCPNCRYNMYEVQSHGIVVDFCLNCQSIWFDEGELSAALAKARERGSINLVPSSTNENDTAALICYMLHAVTTDA